jgi:hypothetical protein
MKELSPQRIKLHSHTHKAITNRARLPQRYNRQLCQQEQRECVQLIHDHNTGQYLNYQQLIHDPKLSKLWMKLLANKFGRLVQGVGGQVKGANTIFFIHKDQVPKDREKDVLYGSFSYDMKPNTEEMECTRLTAGGNRINYPKDVGTPTANMTSVKMLLNSVISTKKQNV